MIHVGQSFDTAFERKCVCVTEPDEFGNFEGIDSEGVRCTFSVAMIEATYLSRGFLQCDHCGPGDHNTEAHKETT